MKKRQTLIKKVLLPTALVWASASNLQAQQVHVDSFTYTGGLQTYTAPCGIDTLWFECFGAQGGNGSMGGNQAPGGVGGKGSKVTGYKVVAPGQLFYISVGGAGATPTGGFNGGGNGGTQNAGGGGGASDVRTGGNNLVDRIIVAGGGGGGGRGGCEANAVSGGNGGAGNTVGVNGTNSADGGGGQGGQLSTGGTAGIGCAGFLGTAGNAGVLGVGGSGGAGQSCCCFNAASIPGGGGGGGGYNGGGGGGGGSAGTTACSGNNKGGGGGGAGGTDYFAGVAGAVQTANVRSGNGIVYVKYNIKPTIPNATISTPYTTMMCAGDTATYTATTNAPATGYAWVVSGGLSIVSGQNTNTIKVTGSTGTVRVVASNACGIGDSTVAFTLTVNPLPTVNLTHNATAPICVGSVVTLTGTPGGGAYSVMSGSPSALTGNVFQPTTQGAYVLKYTYTDANGCKNFDTLQINVNCNLSVQDISGKYGIDIYPNPAHGKFSLSANRELSGRLELRNVTGQVVLSKDLDKVTNEDFIIKHLAPGVYTVEIKTVNGQYTKKLTITQ